MNELKLKAYAAGIVVSERALLETCLDAYDASNGALAALMAEEGVFEHLRSQRRMWADAIKTVSGRACWLKANYPKLAQFREEVLKEFRGGDSPQRIITAFVRQGRDEDAPGDAGAQNAVSQHSAGDADESKHVDDDEPPKLFGIDFKQIAALNRSLHDDAPSLQKAAHAAFAFFVERTNNRVAIFRSAQDRFPTGSFGTARFDRDKRIYFVQILDVVVLQPTSCPKLRVKVSAFVDSKLGYPSRVHWHCPVSDVEPCSFRRVREQCFPPGTRLLVLHDNEPQKATVVGAFPPLRDGYVNVMLSSGEEMQVGEEIQVNVGLLTLSNTFEFDTSPVGAAPEPEGVEKHVGPFDCPICMKPYTAEIFQCLEGHSLCGACFGALKQRICPMCRAPLRGNRNRALEEAAKVYTSNVVTSK